MFQFVWDSVRMLLSTHAPTGYLAEPVEQFKSEDIPGESGPCLSPTRTVDFLNSLLQCPAGSPLGYRLWNNKERMGYGIFMRFEGMCRIVDLRIASGAQADWNQAIAALVAVAREQREISIIRAGATYTMMAKALRANGFWRGARIAIYSKEPLDLSRVHLTLSDGDFCVL
jgi:hypothetical protein